MLGGAVAMSMRWLQEPAPLRAGTASGLPALGATSSVLVLRKGPASSLTGPGLTPPLPGLQALCLYSSSAPFDKLPCLMLCLHAGNTLDEQVEADLAAGAAGRGVPAALEGPGGAPLALEAPAGGLQDAGQYPEESVWGQGAPCQHFMEVHGWPVQRHQGPTCTAPAQARSSWSATSLCHCPPHREFMRMCRWRLCQPLLEQPLAT